MTPICVKLDSFSTACMPDLEHADLLFQGPPDF